MFRYQIIIEFDGTIFAGWLMMLGALLMILQYIAEIIKLTDEKDFK